MRYARVMNEERQGSMVGYVLAALAGVGLGLLLAPRSGRETRRKIGDWLDSHEDDAGFIGKLARLRHPRITTAHHDGRRLKNW